MKRSIVLSNCKHVQRLDRGKLTRRERRTAKQAAKTTFDKEGRKKFQGSKALTETQQLVRLQKEVAIDIGSFNPILQKPRISNTSDKVENIYSVAQGLPGRLRESSGRHPSSDSPDLEAAEGGHVDTLTATLGYVFFVWVYILRSYLDFVWGTIFLMYIIQVYVSLLRPL